MRENCTSVVCVCSGFLVKLSDIVYENSSPSHLLLVALLITLFRQEEALAAAEEGSTHELDRQQILELEREKKSIDAELSNLT